MKDYLQCQGCHQRRSGSSRFDEETIPRTERTSHAIGVASSGTIFSDFVSTIPPMLYGLSITGTEICFTLPRTGTPLSDVDLA